MVLDLFDVDVFSGKNIMITGAGSGIGRATATLLGGLGANLVLVGRDKEKLNITSGFCGKCATRFIRWNGHASLFG